ncbi:hypothetical protein H6785_01150 [Candidatus Nomurabacteria bacterium]|nr:hypothetical protein [Candidatus Nomurabacteria bacterium]
MKLDLQNVTLYGVDTVDLDRQLKAFAICESYADFKAKKIITNLSKEFVTDSGIQIIHTDEVNSLHDYNQFNLKRMNDYFDTDFVMVAEYDGFILNPDAWTDEFLDYDFIGAPLLVEGKQLVGNGGFSIRSKKLMSLLQSDDKIQLGNKKDHRYAENEDWVICVVMREYLENKGIRFAPSELGHKFSLENNREYGNVWNGQFGYHGLRWTDISAWIKGNPQWEIDNPLDKKFPKNSPTTGINL